MDGHDEMTRVQRIAALNDRLRTTGQGGRMFVTRTVAALPRDLSDQLLEAVQTFDAFTRDCDPFGERDFGAVRLEPDGNQFFWKIDYYSSTDLESGSPDPADEAITVRILTLMAAEDL